MLRRAVFLDRDGTLNQPPSDSRYIVRAADLRLMPGVVEAVAALGAHGFLTIVVTNQRCVARGIVSASDVKAINDRMRASLAAHGAHLDDIRVCPHDIGECACRKPLPGLILDAARDWRVDLARSTTVGDSETDVAAGQAAGTRTIRLGHGAVSSADHVADDLRHAVAWLLHAAGRVRRSHIVCL